MNYKVQCLAKETQTAFISTKKWEFRAEWLF